MRYDAFQNQRAAGNLQRGTPGIGLPGDANPYSRAMWEREDDDDKPASSGSAANPGGNRQGERPSPPPQSARNALDRSLAYLGNTVRTPDLNPNTSDPDFYANASKTYSRNADRVERRYARYFDNAANVNSAEIGYAGAKAVADLPDKLAMTEPMSPSAAIAFAKDLSLIATGQYNKTNASPLFWTDGFQTG